MVRVRVPHKTFNIVFGDVVGISPNFLAGGSLYYQIKITFINIPCKGGSCVGCSICGVTHRSYPIYVPK